MEIISTKISEINGLIIDNTIYNSFWIKIKEDRVTMQDSDGQVVTLRKPTLVEHARLICRLSICRSTDVLLSEEYQSALENIAFSLASMNERQVEICAVLIKGLLEKIDKTNELLKTGMIGKSEKSRYLINKIQEIIKAPQTKTPNNMASNITNNFNAPVGQVINHVDKIVANFDKEAQMVIQDTESPSCSNEKSDFSESIEDMQKPFSKCFGRPKSELFENDVIKIQEAQRVKKYIEDNKLIGIKWNTSKGNTVRKMVVCFYKKWEELGFVEATQYPSSAAVVNFFVNECGIQPGVSVDTLKNNTKPWQEEIDEDMMEKVCGVFPQ